MIMTEPLPGAIAPMRNFDVVPNPEFEGLERIEPASFSEPREDGSRRITEVDVHLQDGTVHAGVWAGKTAFELRPTTYDGATIVLTVERAHHILSIHVDGEDSGSTFVDGDLHAIMTALSLALPREASTLNYGSEAFKIGFESQVGWDNLRSIEDLVADGVITECDQNLLDEYRREIIRQNLKGDTSDKQNLVQRFNRKHSAIFLRLVRAGQVVVPHVVAEPTPTETATLAVSTRWRYLGRQSLKYIHSYYPSRIANSGVGKHPIPGEHIKDKKTGSIDMGSFNASAWKWSTHALLVPNRDGTEF